MHHNLLIWQLYSSQLPITIIALLVVAGYGIGWPFGAMQRAAGLRIDMHDFAEKQELKKSTKVLVHRVNWPRRGISSSSGWWAPTPSVKMVRHMVGILVEVGRGNLKDDDVRQLLSGPSDLPAQHTAPPSGLFFERAFYNEGKLREFLGLCPVGNPKKEA